MHLVQIKRERKDGEEKQMRREGDSEKVEIWRDREEKVIEKKQEGRSLVREREVIIGESLSGDKQWREKRDRKIEGVEVQRG